MCGRQTQMFGGGWTEQKLDMLRRYLAAYVTALKNQPFDLLYIDAFAGTGYREIRGDRRKRAPLFAELAAQESQEFLNGSTRIALQVTPPIRRYDNIQKTRTRFNALAKQKEEFSGLAPRIELVNEDCNTYLQAFLRQPASANQRGVLFLDPFGMQVDWTTMQAVSATRTLDVWILFPLSAVNRLLKRDGEIPDEWRERLDKLFGTGDWYDAFYEKAQTSDLFSGENTRLRKVCDFSTIERYYQGRLKTIFADVADNPRELCNSKGSPLFLFCFAMCNPDPNARALAMRIASHILRS